MNSKVFLTQSLPVLIIAWRRQDTLSEVLSALRKVGPRNVFLACDGPRTQNQDDAKNIPRVREILLREIDWPCRISKKFSVNNLGCQKAVGNAINWFFDQVPEGIILEDDCVPHPDFFSFCSELLEKYRHEERIGCITGDNFQDGLTRGGASYYFSKYPHCWGWATWRRSWAKYSAKMEFWPAWRNSTAWLTIFENPGERLFWEKLFEQQFCGQIDSWAYPWTASLWHAGSLTVTPQHNLVQNIGFGGAATHTKNTVQKLSVPTKPLKITTHPEKILPHVPADRHVFEHVFCDKKKGVSLWLQRFLQSTRAMLGKTYES